MERACATNATYHFLRICSDDPDKKMVPIAGKKNEEQNPKTATYYYEVPLKFNYGSSIDPDKKTFYYEACELTTLYGVVDGLDKYEKHRSTISFTFDEKDPNHIKCMNDIDDICAGIARMIYCIRDKVNYDKFDVSTVKLTHATGFKALITRKAGKNSALYCDLINYTTPEFSAKTLFTYVNVEGESKIVDWKDLKGVSFKCIPLFRFKHVYVGGGRASIKWDVKSAIITSDPIPYKPVSMQADTAKRLAQERPNWGSSIEAQIAKNSMIGQEKKMGANLYIPPTNDETNTTNAPAPTLDTSAETVGQTNVNTPTNFEEFMNTSGQQPQVWG
jgi:hypothetical protein